MRDVKCPENKANEACDAFFSGGGVVRVRGCNPLILTPAGGGPPPLGGTHPGHEGGIDSLSKTGSDPLHSLHANETSGVCLRQAPPVSFQFSISPSTG